MKMQLSWYNFRTGQHDYRDMPKTLVEACDYVPQMGGVGLMQIYVEHQGMSISDAMIKVLRYAAGERDEEQKPNFWEKFLDWLLPISFPHPIEN